VIDLPADDGLGDEAEVAMPPEGEDLGDPHWLQSALEEYRALRAEVLVALQSHLTTLRYGITAGALLTAVSLQLSYRKETVQDLGWIIALVLVPLVNVFAATTWMGEYERMARAGSFLSNLETRINDRFAKVGQDAPMEWETWLREGGPDSSRQTGTRHRYVAIVLVFVALQAVATTLGAHELWHEAGHETKATVFLPLGILASVVTFIAMIRYFRLSGERVRFFASPPRERYIYDKGSLGVRLRLYLATVVCMVLTVPLPLWGLGVVLAFLLPGPLVYLAACPALAWIALLPTFLPGGFAFNARDRWSPGPRRDPTPEEQDVLKQLGVRSPLGRSELARLQVADEVSVNVTPAGRIRPSVTSKALTLPADELRAVLAHEVAHDRLGHFRPVSLAFDYLSLYCWSELQLRMWWQHVSRRKVDPFSMIAYAVVHLLWLPVAVLPGISLNVLRRAWQRAEMEADRYALKLGYGADLRDLLKTLEQTRTRRFLGPVPLPRVHPTPQHRAARLTRTLERHARRAQAQATYLQGDMTG
jgi:Zn-dependent protease with chaperone function